MLKRIKFKKSAVKRKGQSTVEYIILVAAVLGAIIVFLGPNGVFQNAVNETFSTGTTGMTSIANRLASSRPDVTVLANGTVITTP